MGRTVSRPDVHRDSDFLRPAFHGLAPEAIANRPAGSIHTPFDWGGSGAGREAVSAAETMLAGGGVICPRCGGSLWVGAGGL